MSASISTIPASTIVSVVPSVVSGGGNALDLIELMLTTNPLVPIGQVLSFPTLASVQSYFGATSNEAVAAAVYFSGFSGCTKLPGALLFAQYPLAAVSGYVRGGALGLTLTQLQALTGSMTVVTDAGTQTNGSLSLSAASSFALAALILLEGLPLVGATQATATGSIGASFTGTGTGTSLVVTSVTGYISAGDVLTGTGVPVGTRIVSQSSGTTGGAGTYVTSVATTASAAAITSISTFIDITAVATGTVTAGQQITAASGITGVSVIASQVSGTTGGVGIYQMSQAPNSTNTLASRALTLVNPAIQYNTTAGAFEILSGTTGANSFVNFPTGTLAASLNLTLATGAVQSAGAAAAVPGAFMAGILAITTNWATFQTLFDPDQGSGNTQKLLFAAWVNSTTDSYLYLDWDTDITPTESTDAAASQGQILAANDSTGTALIWEPAGANLHHAAFLGGYVASLNFDQTNGRATAAFRNQPGLTPSVTTATVAANLLANNYNYYGIYGTANQDFDWFYDGGVLGPYEWIDSYVNQIWLSNACQLALMEMLGNYLSIPYNPVGYGYIRAALADPIAAALNFGAIRQNVPLSAAQASEVNAIAGQTVAPVLSTVGWYLVIQPATAQVRAARQSPTIILLYMDGESVQKVNLSSILVQ